MVYIQHVTLTVLTSLLFRSLDARSDGADPYACSDLTPLHGSRQRDDRPPYYIQVSNTTYTPGVPITVTLSSDSGQFFKGFLIQARVSEQGPDYDKPVGTFTPVTGTKSICLWSVGLTHIDSHPKSSLTFDWIPPDRLYGKIPFKTTFVQSRYSYWVAHLSDIVNEGQTTTSSTTTPTTATSTSTSTSMSYAASSKMTSTTTSEAKRTLVPQFTTNSTLPPSNTTQPTVGDGGGVSSVTPTCICLLASLCVLYVAG